MTFDKNYMDLYVIMIRIIPIMTYYLLFLLFIINLFKLNIMGMFVVVLLCMNTLILTHSIKDLVCLIQQEPSTCEYISLY